MRSNNGLRLGLALVGAWMALLAYPAASRAQEMQTPPSQSVADAARAARANKKNASKPTKVISDDDLDSKPKPGAEGLNVGSAPTSDAVPPNPAAVVADEAADRAAANAEKNAIRKGEDPEIAKAKEEVAEAAKQLDLLQRAYALDQDTYYSKPSYTDDKNGKAKLDAELAQINDKQAEVDRLKARVAELEQARGRKKAAAAQGSGLSQDEEKPAEAPAPPQS
jgi:hypothetical protein